MNNNLPGPLNVLIEQFIKLPGFGQKAALRATMQLLKWPEEETRRFGHNITSLRDNLHLCSRCGSISTDDPCKICTDPNRAKDILCIVSEWDSLLTLEQGNFYQGQYLILGGLLAPMEKKPDHAMEIEKLKTRLAEGQIKEVIFALGSTVEAENTASFLQQMIKTKFPYIQTSRLAQGIPLGAEVKYMDKATLYQSLKYRQILS